MSALDLMAWAQDTYRDRFAVVTAFQPEGMVLVDMAVRHAPQVRIVTVDTGRLPQETYDIMDTVRVRYGVTVEVVMPDAPADNLEREMFDGGATQRPYGSAWLVDE